MLMLGSAVAVAAILAIVTWLLFRELDTANEAAVRSANNVVQLIDADVQRNAELYDTSLQGLIAAWRRPDVMTISPELRQLVLFDRATAAPYKGDLVLLDDTGRIVADSTSLTPRQDNFSDRPGFQEHRDSGSLALVVDGPFLSRWGFKDLCISFSRRLPSDNGQFVGIASASMRLSYFDQLFRTLDIGPTSTVNLLSADGVMLARQPDDNNRTFIGQNFSMRPNFKRILQEVNGSFAAVSELDGAQRLYTFSRVGDLPLIVVVAQSRDDVYAVWKRNALLVAGATGLLCIGILLLSWLLGRQLRLRQNAERELAGLASTDGLTGLANRRRLDQVLKQEWARGMRSGKPLALLMIDVDHFKAFNDRHGHHGGDVALRSVAQTLAASIRRPGDLAARYGGEEFMVVLPETDKAGACVIAEKLRQAIEALPLFAEDTVPITVSIGIATHLPVTHDQPELLFHAADRALYRAKKNGRNRVEVEPYATPSAGLQK
ncbi:diguanylate cyclase (GGDEF)-like protein [Pseudomonas graminis]|uniref:GGDEF domain-containing protein n=1 Tax=Pseudomonas graminis TaxID=158627 RepID=UPI0010601D37|nr:sensor domain-containing diguanylate cyclase [Pseudomonas graminis]TDV55652.1 diguanylate cyclase (GGDEF)-like protein [Pseudomonas graminis]